MKFWELKPVQSGAKALGAGILAVGAYYAYSKTGEYFGKHSDLSLINLKKFTLNDKRLKSDDLDLMWSLDPDTIEILLRLETFRKFAPYEYGDIVLAFYNSLKIKNECYQKDYTATSSFKIRKAFQEVIEKLRIFRAVVEKLIPTALEDFDEVAVDINSKIEQVSNDAIQDTY